MGNAPPEKLSQYIKSLRARIIDPAILGLINGIKAAKNFLLGEIETPTALIKAIERNCAELEKYIPHLKDKLKQQKCGDIYFTEQAPSTDPLLVLVGDTELRMHAESDDYFKLYTWLTINILKKYINNQHAQHATIKLHCLNVLREYSSTKREDLPNLLRELCDSIRNTITK